MDLVALRPFWHPAAPAADLADTPKQVTLLGEQLAIWRTADGVAAVADTCVHRGTALSGGRVTDGCISCPYHAWQFDSTGRCTRIPQQDATAPIPARAAVAAHHCVERYGLIWVCLAETPHHDIAPFPEFADPGYRHALTVPYTWAADAGRMLENFTDFGHLAWVHPGLLGDPDYPLVPDTTVVQDGPTLRYSIAVDAPAAKSGDTDITSADQTAEYIHLDVRYQLTLPFTIHFVTEDDAGGVRLIYFVVQPVDETHATGYAWMGRNYDFETPDSVFTDFQSLIAEQDRVIVESQRPAQLPLGPADEFQLSFDKVAINYRRAMTALLAG